MDVAAVLLFPTASVNSSGDINGGFARCRWLEYGGISVELVAVKLLTVPPDTVMSFAAKSLVASLVKVTTRGYHWWSRHQQCVRAGGDSNGGCHVIIGPVELSGSGVVPYRIGECVCGNINGVGAAAEA